MNDLLQDIEQLEGYVNKLKKLKHTPAVKDIIRQTDDMIEKKKLQFHNYEHQMQREYFNGINRS